MTTTAVRRGVAVILLLAQAACAAQGAGRTAPAPRVTDAEREQCGFLAADEAARESAASREDGGLGGLVFIGLMGGPAAALMMAPLVVVVANKGRWKAEAQARGQRMESCLAPILLAQEHGPDHPSVTAALTALAGRYAELRQYHMSEPLYARATAIAEKAGDPVALADVLEHHAATMWTMQQGDEALALETRAGALRAQRAAPSSGVRAPDDEPDDATPAGS